MAKNISSAMRAAADFHRFLYGEDASMKVSAQQDDDELSEEFMDLITAAGGPYSRDRKDDLDPTRK